MTGVILLNMGGPDKLEAVEPFLYNLFSDRYIIELGPKFLQRPVAWLIAKRRAPKSRENYKLIGGKSPLAEITQAQAKGLERTLRAQFGSRIRIVCKVGMRYWHPRTPAVLEDLKKQGVRRVLGLSLYPHYSRATSGTSLNEFKEASKRLDLEFSTVEHYPTHPSYINAIRDVIHEAVEKIGGPPFHLVYSAHSLPQKFIDQGDPYLSHIEATIEALEQVTGIHGTLAFQSRSGPVKWLEPQTSEHLMELVRKGVKRILCVPISFVSDHIETLYEIDMLFKGMVKEKGGELFMTPGLNTRPSFINALCDITSEALRSLNWL